MKRLTFLLLALLFVGNLSAGNWDYRVTKRINSVDSRFVNGLSNGLSQTAPYLVVGVPTVIGIYSLVVKNERKFFDAIYIGSTVVEAFALTTSLKYAIDRKRPFQSHSDIIKRENVDSPSFPSGHTSGAFALATSLSISYPKWYVIAPSVLWATGVGCSRIYEGVHYPTDVLAGAFLGAGSAYLNYLLNKWMINNYQWKGKVFRKKPFAAD